MTNRLRHAKTAAFADFWYAAREEANGLVPAKPDLSMRALAPFMPSLSLTEDRAGLPYYVLCGTEIVREFGVDPTDTCIFDYMSDDARDQFMEGIAEFATFTPGCVFARWSIGRAITTVGREIEYECLTLPYFEPTRDKNRFMTYANVLTTLDFGEGVANRYPDIVYKVFDALAPRPAWMQLG